MYRPPSMVAMVVVALPPSLPPPPPSPPPRNHRSSLPRFPSPQDLIHKGASGSSYRALHTETSRFFYIKAIACTKDQRRTLLAETVLAMEAGVTSPSLAAPEGVYRDRTTGDLCIMYPYYSAGSLADLLSAAQRPPTPTPNHDHDPSSAHTTYDSGHAWCSGTLAHLERNALGGGSVVPEKKNPEGHHHPSLSRMQSPTPATPGPDGTTPPTRPLFPPVGLSEEAVIPLLAGVVDGLAAFYETRGGRAHGGICPANLLLDVHTGGAVLCGAGFRPHLRLSPPVAMTPTLPRIATEIKDVHESNGGIGPVSGSNQHTGPKSAVAIADDVWALGVLALEALLGYVPFPSHPAEYPLREAGEAMRVLDTVRGSALSPALRDFVAACLSPPGDRPSVVSLRRHPLLREQVRRNGNGDRTDRNVGYRYRCRYMK